METSAATPITTSPPARRGTPLGGLLAFPQRRFSKSGFERERRTTLQRRECALVIAALIGIWWFNGALPIDVLSSTAVFLTFVCTQVAFDLADAAQTPAGSADRSRLRLTYVVKECTWLVTFTVLGSWPLVFGSLLFASYPALRRLHRHGSTPR